MYGKNISSYLIVHSTCPHCDTRNRINQGDTYNYRGVDKEAIRCWKCNQVHFLGTEEDFRTEYYPLIWEDYGEDVPNVPITQDMIISYALVEDGQDPSLYKM